MPKLIRLKPVSTRYGKSVQRIEAIVICVGEMSIAVEVNGERFSAKTADLKLAKAAMQ